MFLSHFNLPTHPPFLKCNGGEVFLKHQREIFFPLRFSQLFSRNIQQFNHPFSPLIFHSPFHYKQFFINFISESISTSTHQITLPNPYLSKLELKYR
uniref:Uncharacterized protein n=1 Tax=Bacteriophage sp. TaxID=38018 RepID=A0A8D9PEP2_9VIRU|nr:MAG TPA: hypothetical protein [Bacteriophage sp.]